MEKARKLDVLVLPSNAREEHGEGYLSVPVATVTSVTSVLVSRDFSYFSYFSFSLQGFQRQHSDF